MAPKIPETNRVLRSQKPAAAAAAAIAAAPPSKPTEKPTEKPKATKPKATKPKTTLKAKATASKVTKPKAKATTRAAKAKATKPKATKAKATKAKTTKPKATKPKATKAKTTENEARADDRLVVYTFSWGNPDTKADTKPVRYPIEPVPISPLFMGGSNLFPERSERTNAQGPTEAERKAWAKESDMFRRVAPTAPCFDQLPPMPLPESWLTNPDYKNTGESLSEVATHPGEVERWNSCTNVFARGPEEVKPDTKGWKVYTFNNTKDPGLEGWEVSLYPGCDINLVKELFRCEALGGTFRLSKEQHEDFTFWAENKKKGSWKFFSGENHQKNDNSSYHHISYSMHF